jgi:hypothetical protein
VKKDLSNQGIVRAAEEQLAGYVTARAVQTCQRYVGVLTDGREWHAHQEQSGNLVDVTRHLLRPTKPDGTALLFWLEGVLATRKGVPPTPNEIRARLGATSASYALDRATPAALYADHGATETIRLKRQLWSQLLRGALGTQFIDDDELFLEHTLLVNSAEIIAHLVVGLDVADMQPASLLGAQRFDLAAIYGVVERDFFDWVLEVPSGDAFVRTLARRLARFDWTDVEHERVEGSLRVGDRVGDPQAARGVLHARLAGRTGRRYGRHRSAESTGPRPGMRFGHISVPCRAPLSRCCRPRPRLLRRFPSRQLP